MFSSSLRMSFLFLITLFLSHNKYDYLEIYQLHHPASDCLNDEDYQMLFLTLKFTLHFKSQYTGGELPVFKMHFVRPHHAFRHEL